MKFNEKSIRERLPKDIGKQGGGLDILPFLKEHSLIHNHYELAWDFTKTDLFKRVQKTLDPEKTCSWDEARVGPFNEVREEQIKINTSILEKKQIEENDVIQILEGLVKHLCAQNPNEPDIFRFRANCWEDVTNKLEGLKTSIEVANTINQYKDDPETNGFEYKYWNSMTGDIWACVQGNLYDEVFYLTNTLRDLIYKIYKYKPTNCVFKNVLDQETHGRFLMTLWMAEGLIYQHTKDIEKAIECYSNIGNLYNSASYPSTDPKGFSIWWFTGQTRIIEALIQVYKLKPTEELKQRILNYYIDSCYHTGYEPTETVRERGIITYMLARYVLNIKI